MKTFLAAVLLSCVFTLSCKEKKDAGPKISGDCISGNIVKIATDRIGTVSFNAQENSYIISYHEPGTYDSIDFGYTCNLPDNMKEPALKVQFSGEYRKHPLPPTFGGSANYYLKLTKIERL